MNKLVKKALEEIEKDPRLHFKIRIYRPFITASILNAVGQEFGIGTACVQLPDPWDVALGTKAAKTRAVKHMLGIPNPRIANLIAHESA